MKLKSSLIVFLLIWATSLSANADIAIIVNPENSITSIELEDLQEIYLGRTKRFHNGDVAMPIDHKLGESVRESFNEKILGRTSKQVKAYWAQLVFTGRGWPPIQMLDDASIKAAVAKDPSAIGYIDASLVDDTVKVVHRFQ